MRRVIAVTQLKLMLRTPRGVLVLDRLASYFFSYLLDDNGRYMIDSQGRYLVAGVGTGQRLLVDSNGRLLSDNGGNFLITSA